MNKIARRLCIRCNKEVQDRHSFYCSCECFGKYQQEQLWKEWDKNGITSTRSKTIKEYIKHKKGNKCSICSMPAEWEFKPIVMILDHINGNPGNNDLTNLRLVCPNCDSQLSTFKGRNKGNGRHSRKERYKEGKSY